MQKSMPKKGTLESLDLDFKQKYESGRRGTGEMAKDICSFANTVGGRIIIGATESSSKKIASGNAVKNSLGGYRNIDEKEANQYVIQFDECRNIIRPRPKAKIEIVKVEPGKTVVVINIEASVGCVHGCPVLGKDENEKEKWIGLVFPRRSFTGTDLISPESFGSYIDHSLMFKFRQISVLLEQVSDRYSPFYDPRTEVDNVEEYLRDLDRKDAAEIDAKGFPGARCVIHSRDSFKVNRPKGVIGYGIISDVSFERGCFRVSKCEGTWLETTKNPLMSAWIPLHALRHVIPNHPTQQLMATIEIDGNLWSMNRENYTQLTWTSFDHWPK